ncbi:MAG: glutamine synthetase family protein [Chloroflexota bacterium]|nr:glutamine synthetase family protein [Chloroflexota bacterium]
MSASLRDFLAMPYEQLEELNLAAKAQRAARVDAGTIQEERMKWLADTKGVKAVTVLFTDLEGRLHMLDYDKKFLLKSADNLTFDGSSIRGFTPQSESDLRLGIDWSAFYWVPADFFGSGKVLVFGEVLEKDGTPYAADMRAMLKGYAASLYAEHGYTLNVANEIEGFLFLGQNAEQHYAVTGKFEMSNTGGYYHSLPGDPLRSFIDAAAEVQRALGFANEKDHPEVAPSQFEMNYSYAEAGIAADQIQLYKLLCRQVAYKMGMTASFLPKPLTGVNGSGMHTNMSVSHGDTNLFWDANGRDKISDMAWGFVNRILAHAKDLCLVLNSSVNSYRRLDPHFEAPNEIKSSPVDRGSMVRIPIGNSRSARIEVRSVAPDANPYMTIFSLFKTGLEGQLPAEIPQGEILPDNIYDGIALFANSEYSANLFGADVAEKFAALKLASADRCARRLGTLIKPSEIQFHHEVYNQYLWNQF